MSDTNVGFIGLGNVGSKLANSILISEYNLFIYDLEKKKGDKQALFKETSEIKN